jgi:hypothetical protein
MNDADHFEGQGQWWLPERENHKVSGTLKYDPISGTSLHLIGALGGLFESTDSATDSGATSLKITQASLRQAGVYPRIHGFAGSKPFTLVDCFQTYASMGLMNGSGIERIHVNRFLRGATFEPDEELAATDLSLRIKYLGHFIDRSGIEKREVPPREKGALHSWLTGKDLVTEAVTLRSGDTVELAHWVGLSGNQINEFKMTQEFLFRISSPALRSMDEFIEVASDIKDLISITTNRAASFIELSFLHPEVYQGDDDVRYPENIDYFASWNAKEDDQAAELHRYRLLFSYSDFDGIAGLARWLEAASKHRDALSRVMATRYAKRMFVSDQLLNLAASLEAFDRTIWGFANSTFKTRLDRCVVLAGEPFRSLVGNDTGSWVEMVKTHRDDVAHHFGHFINDASSNQFFLSQSLYWMFVFCMLREAGAPDKVFTRIQNHQDFLWLAPKIQSAIAAEQH